MKDKGLLSITTSPGCSAKMAPGVLEQIITKLPKFENDNLMVSMDTSDDAGVYKINDDTALIQTVDFFNPMVNDAYIFGQIAAANSLSDIYAMGGTPITALNVVAYPQKMDMNILGDILKGGADKLMESGACLIGGHTINDPAIKYGMSVTGIAKPDCVIANSGSRSGDYLILTKLLGTGIAASAMKGELATADDCLDLINSMTTLNRAAAEVMNIVPVNACTDITGFGFLGHLREMMVASNVTAEIDVETLPVSEQIFDWAKMGILSGSCYSNKNFISDDIAVGKYVSETMLDVMYDPQTSGGLLMSVSEQNFEEMVSSLSAKAVRYSVVGRVLSLSDKKIILKGCR